MGAIIWLLIGQRRSLFLCIWGAAGEQYCRVIIHIPAGIGVLEAVFIALLAGSILRRRHYRRPARLACALLFSSAVAGDGVLSAAGKSGEKAAGKKRESLSEVTGYLLLIRCITGLTCRPDTSEFARQLTAITENTQQHQEQVDEVQIQR